MRMRMLLASLLTLAWISFAQAAVIDAPHNESNQIKCSDCHSYSLWFQFTPHPSNPNPDMGLVANGICQRCHKTNGSGPNQALHAKASMSSHNVALGEWTTACTACHDPHFQAQLDAWVASDPTNLYLASGTFGNSATFIFLNNTTKFSYTVTPGGNPNWTDPATWRNKNGSQRGLILVQDKLLASNTFQVVGADASTVTVKGIVPTSAAGKSFGLIYGQLINAQIVTPQQGNRAIKFYDPNLTHAPGGLTDTNLPPTGICQVCHTLSKYWRQDGTLGNHYPTGRCLECHTSATGFSPPGALHASLTSIASCLVCHPGADIVADTHGNSCGKCHLNAGGGGILRSPWATNNPTGGSCVQCHFTFMGHAKANDHANQVTTLASCLACHPVATNPVPDVHGNNCALCHDTTPATEGKLKGSATKGVGDCATCHVPPQDANNHLSQHNATGFESTTLNSGIACLACHGELVNVSAGHLGKLDHASQVITCQTCHRSTDPLVVAAIASGKGGSTVYCRNCHGERPMDHPNKDHAAILLATVSCVGCHTHNEADRALGVHKLCTVCHNPTTMALQGSAAGKQAGASCITCHAGQAADWKSHAKANDHSTQVLADNACSPCHAVTADAVPEVHGNKCQLCHDPLTGLPLSLATAGPGTCATCHVAGFNAHTHSHKVVYNPLTDLAQDLPGTPCANCHGALPTMTEIKTLHLNNCATCHSSPRAEVKTTIAAKANPTNCIPCHTLKLTPDLHGVDHSLLVSATASCVVCHANANLTTGIHATKGCLTCHSQTIRPVVLIGSAANHRVPEDGALNTCATCHGLDFKTIHPATVDHATKVKLAANCGNCHTATPLIAAASPRSHHDCYSCHNPDGTLVPRAQAGAGGNADCQTCHGGFGSNHSNVNHAATARVTMAADCSGCHLDPALTFIAPGNPKVHQGCATCHAANGTLVPGATPGGGSCTSCHGNYFSQHQNINHTASRVTLAANCSGCHLDPATTFLAPGNPKVHQACASCHTASGALRGSAIPGGGSCTSCHGEYFASHQNINHTASRITMAADCATCHPAVTAAVIDPANPKAHKACATCHAANGTLVATAVAGGGSCTTCHGSYFSLHKNINHTASRVTLAANCALCHLDPTVSFIDAANPKVHKACATCHAANGALVAGATAGGGSCTTCHGNYFGSHKNIDHTASRVTLAVNCAACHPNPSAKLTDPGNLKNHQGCDSCHGVTGALKGSAVAGGGSCTTCHGEYFTLHITINHTSSRVTLAANCAGCHLDPAATFLAPGNPKVHQACATCHDATGILKGSAIPGGGSCTSCHGDYFSQHQNINHTVSRVTLAADCATCHPNPATTFIAAGNPKAHQACATCHAANGSLTGSAIAGGGNCKSCHGEYFALHKTINHTTSRVTLAANCATCHPDPTVTFVNSSNPKAHKACATCHAANGTLIGSAVAGGGSCTTCHGSAYFDSHKNINHTASRVTLAADCATCHPAPTVTFIDPANPKVHKACATCHGVTGALKGSAIAGGGSCKSCHGEYFALHKTINHTASRVTLAANCALCHPNPTASFIDPLNKKAHKACTSCHAANGTLVGSAVAGGGDCTACHGSYFDLHQTINHTTSRVTQATNCATCHPSPTVTFIDPLNKKAHKACSSCHTATGAMKSPAVAGGGSCVTCHGNYFSLHQNIDHLTSRVTLAANCALCHPNPTTTFIDPLNKKVHKACTTCHSATGLLIGSAIAGGGSCTVCHGSYFSLHKTIDHTTNRVKIVAECGVCHPNPLTTFIDPLNKKAHKACTSCHGATGALIGHAVAGGGDCKTCHGSYFYLHANIDHATNRVKMASDCATCHPSPATVFVDPLNKKAHKACSTCHTATGTLAAGVVAGGGDCKVCHGSYFPLHKTIDHTSSRVTLASDCATCHPSPTTTFINATNKKVHKACTSCHGANGGLIGSAVAGGGDCKRCHGAYLPSHKVIDHNYRSIGFGTGLACANCHSSDPSRIGYVGTGTLVSQNDIDKLHGKVKLTTNACESCHYYNAATQANPEGLPLQTTVVQAINNGMAGTATATCVVCHDYNQSNHGSIDHKGLAKVTATASCAHCHDKAGTADYITDIHKGSCGKCHLLATGGGALVAGISSGDCAHCHAATRPLTSPDIGANFFAHPKAFDHNNQVSTTARCIVCHTGAATTGVHLSCTSCHDGASGALKGSGLNREGLAPNQCSDCHGAIGSDFNAHPKANDHANQVTATALCVTCHSGATTTVVHARLGCATCHTPSTGALTGSAAPRVGLAPNQCSDCHFATFVQHQNIDHTTSRVTMAAECSDCHPNPTATFIDPASQKVHHACTTCHNSAGALIGSALPGGGDCKRCHGNYFPQHKVVDHNYRTIGYGTGTACGYCHTNDTAVLGNAGTGTLVGTSTLITQNNINLLHGRVRNSVNACEVCHYYNQATQSNPESLPTKSAIVNAINNGMAGTAAATCVVCHDYNLTGHWGQPQP